MDAWKSSPIYRLWVIGGLIAIVAFAVTPLGESGPGFPLVLLPAIGLVLIGAGRAIATLRSYRRGELPGQK